ncbi:hypothetical protein V2J09_000235 [Rumex salicifolius]
MRLTKPLFFQSKLLCFSCLYLLTTLSLSLYLSFSPSSKCFFRSSPFDPIQFPLFSYPSSYGESKHSLKTLRSDCSSPVFFFEYSRALAEIDDSTTAASALRYLEGLKTSFGGNFSAVERFSMFNHLTSGTEIPCGFLKPFPIHPDDRAAMQSCKGVVVVSAIFGDHDRIRQPKGLGSKTLDDACFFMFVDSETLKGLEIHKIIPQNNPKMPYKVGAWRLVNVSTNDLYENPAMNGVIPKYLVHRLFPNAKYSLWVDAKLQLAVDPMLLIHSLVVKEGADMAVSKHPFFKHTMEEAMATSRWRKWLDVEALKVQMETYCEHGLLPWSPNKLPYTSDVPDTALIIRKHGEATDLFSCLMFNELDGFNHRDQLAFAFVRDKMSPKLKLNMFEVEVFEQVTIEYRHNLHKVSGPNSAQQLNKNGPNNKRVWAKPEQSLSASGGLGKCQKYFEEMWGQ